MGKSIIIEQAKKVSEEQVERATFIGLSLFTLVYPLLQYIWPLHPLGNQLQDFLLVWTSIYFIVLFGIQRINKRIVIGKKNIAGLFLLVMLLIGLFSCLWNGKFETTVYGNDFQGECLLIHMAYYMICLSAMQLRKKEYREGVMTFLILILGFIALFGVLQFLQIPFINHKILRSAVYPARNRNFYAAFPVLLNGLLFGKILYGEKKSRGAEGFWHILLMISFGACVAAQSMLVYLGVIMQFVIAIFLAFFKERRKLVKIAAMAIEFLFVFCIFDLISGGAVVLEVLSLSKQIEQEGSLLGDYVGSGRMAIWKAVLDKIPENWLFGCGIERLGVSCEIGEIAMTAGNAHNEYLQIWVTQGTFAILSYLVFLFALFIPGILQFIKKDRYDSDFVSKAALFSFFGYIAQAFANIRVIQVAPYFFLICGLLYIKKRDEEGSKLGGSNEKRKKD